MAQKSQAVETRLVPLAWCGWRMRVPESWRPLQIEGAWEKGMMMVGTTGEALFQIKWWRPNARNFSPQEWLDRRLQRMAAIPSTESPRPKGFGVHAYLPEAPSKGGGSRSIWYGYCACANLVLEVAVNRAVAKRTQSEMRRKVLPGVSATPLDGETLWAIFDVSFVSPRGFTIKDWNLYSGDITLRFCARDKSTLVVRQVYPADVALERRKMERWLVKFPFKEHRRYRRTAGEKPWSASSRKGRWSGRKRTGRKLLAFPLRFVSARYSVAVAARDTEMNRLLLAEYDSRGEGGEDTVRTAILNMNWAKYGEDAGA